LPEKPDRPDLPATAKSPVHAGFRNIAPQKHRDSGNFNRRQAKKP
jgi:hypothetical protein